MHLLLMRHASAVRGGSFSDADRPLLAEGELQAERAGRALQRLALGLSAVWTSPALRCRHTAEIVTSHFAADPVKVQVIEAMAVGGGAERIAAALREQLRPPFRAADDGTLLLVAHQPDLEQLASVLLGGTGASPLSFQPGGCALLRVVSRHETLRAKLHWLLTPAWFELVTGI